MRSRRSDLVLLGREASDDAARSRADHGRRRATPDDPPLRQVPGHRDRQPGPRGQGRIRVSVPEVLVDVDSGWALPCTPYAGDKTGAYAVPPKDAGVWVEFEAGDVSRPIWVGGWWASDKVPTDEEGAKATPDVKVTRSEQGLIVALHDDSQTIAVSDSNGSNILRDRGPGRDGHGQGGDEGGRRRTAHRARRQRHPPRRLRGRLTTYLNQLVQSINVHMHPGQMAATVPVTPAPPAAPALPPTPDLLSTDGEARMTKLIPGTLNEATGLITPSTSMAAAIEAAMNARVPVGAGEDPRGRRRLAVAIATGVIKHLKDKEQAFVVNVRDSGGSPIERTVRIDT